MSIAGDTVDGSEILHDLRCIKPCKSWDKLPTSTGAGFLNHQQYHHFISFFSPLSTKLSTKMSLKVLPLEIPSQNMSVFFKKQITCPTKSKLQQFLNWLQPPSPRILGAHHLGACEKTFLAQDRSCRHAKGWVVDLQEAAAGSGRCFPNACLDAWAQPKKRGGFFWHQK